MSLRGLARFFAVRSFNENLSMGRVGEGVISRWLQGRGHLVFPAYEIECGTGKGPQLFGANKDLVLPDLLSFRNGEIMWFEAKHKTCFTWHRMTKRWVTGIDLRHYKEYIEVSRETRLPVWLLFFHPMASPSNEDLSHGCPPFCPTGLFGNEISILAKNENHRSDKWGKTGMVYWSVDCLKLIAEIDSI